MTEIPNAITSLPIPKQVAALLCLGWTHAEIASATDISKGSVQNYKEKMRDGELTLPAEVFPIIRSRMREIHRACRKSGEPDDIRIEQLADRLKTLNEFELLDIHEDGRITYEDLVAFAELVAGQISNESMQSVVGTLSDLYTLGSDVATIRCMLQLRYAHIQASLLNLQVRVEERRRNEGKTEMTDISKNTGGVEDLNEGVSKRIEKNWHNAKNAESNQPIESDLIVDEEIEFGSDGESMKFDMTDTRGVNISEEECRRRGGRYDPKTGSCHFRRFPE